MSILYAFYTEDVIIRVTLTKLKNTLVFPNIFGTGGGVRFFRVSDRAPSVFFEGGGVIKVKLV